MLRKITTKGCAMRRGYVFIFSVFILLLGTVLGCKQTVSQDQTRKDSTPTKSKVLPASVKNLVAVYSFDNKTIAVTWQNPPGKDLKELHLSYKKDGSTIPSNKTLGKDRNSFTITNIPDDGSTYTITITAKDDTGNESSPAETTVKALVTPEITRVSLNRTRLDTEMTDRTITVTIEGRYFHKVNKLVVRVMDGSDTQQEVEAPTNSADNSADNAVTATVNAPKPTSLTKWGKQYRVKVFIDEATTPAGKTASFTVTPPAHVDQVSVYPSEIPFNASKATVTVKGTNIDLCGKMEIKLFDSHNQKVYSSTAEVEVGKNKEEYKTEIIPPRESGKYTVKVFFKGIDQQKTASLQRYEAPEITSVTIPKAGTRYGGKKLPVTIRGKNFIGLNESFSISSPQGNMNFTKFKVWSNTEATTEIDCPDAAGDTCITVHCDTVSNTGTLSVIDSSTYTVGMIVLANKTLSDKDTYTGIDKSNPPIGIVFDIYGVPKILALHVSAQTFRWAKNFTSGYTKCFQDIICTPVKPTDEPAKTATFRGDTDGSDNWDYIKSIDPTGTADAETFYPVFNWVNTYNTTYAAQLGGKEFAWYIPSIAELCAIYRNREKIDASLKAIHNLDSNYADESFKRNSYWSSSQVQRRGTDAWSVVFQNGNISADAKFLDIQACAITSF